jgi:disulfide bond formation protein DsbB
MLENLPFEDTLSIVLAGDGNCADVSWTFLGLSIPEQTLLIFCTVILIGLWQAARHYPEHS